jgi:aminobenzoyl-glutamate utilization protein B
LHWHPGTDARVTNIRSTATTSLTIEFAGKTAHAGSAPWLGRSAVHAAELFAHGVNLMREHVEPTARIHYVYESGGLAPNIVPDYARIRMFVRDTDRAHVEASVAWVQQIAEGAAMATQTKATVDVYNGMYDLMPNTPLAEQLQTHMERIGIPPYSDEERAFAEELQRNAGVTPNGLTTATSPMPDGTFMMGASTDVGDVSWLTPTMGCSMPTMPIGINLHTWAATASHGTPIGLKGAVYAARALAALGADLVADADLRKAARADFERRTADKPYISALPEGQKLPRGLEH